jgi:hypothetical protein
MSDNYYRALKFSSLNSCLAASEARRRAKFHSAKPLDCTVRIYPTLDKLALSQRAGSHPDVGERGAIGLALS